MTTTTACHDKGIMWGPVYFVSDPGPKIKIAVIRQCVQCYRLLGDFILIKPHSNKGLAAILKKFHGTSQAMLLDAAIKRPGSPLNMKDGTAGLVPEFYQGEVKAQPDLAHEPAPDEPDEEIPF